MWKSNEWNDKLKVQDNSLGRDRNERRKFQLEKICYFYIPQKFICCAIKPIPARPHICFIVHAAVREKLITR